MFAELAVLLWLAGGVPGAEIIRTASPSCSEVSSVLGGCPTVGGSIVGNGAVLDGQLAVGGRPGSGGSGGGGASGYPALPPTSCEEVFVGYCYGEGRDKALEPTPGIPAVTLSDLAVFRPRAAVQFMQPDGWMVVGLPANFVAVIDRHVVNGTLLGAPADVRFTPVAYRWRYGDGTSARLGTRGASWAALGLSEFDPTPTSHVYRASATYVIELDVEYAAEYRFAGGAYTSLTGVIVLPANDLVATAGGAVTVLVDRDCARAPTGPGC